METVILHAENKEQLTALKAFAKALKVKFETTKSPYHPEFVAKIKESRKQVEDGNYIKLDPNKSIWENVKEESLQESPGFGSFSGIWSKDEADEIERIIAESCENIHPDN